MQLKFYNWAGAPNVIRKALTAQPNMTLDGTLREQCSIEAPSILIQADPIGQNYVHIPEFSRYYFITDVVAVRNGAFRIELRVDVLKTYETRLLACSVYGIRSAVQQTPYIPDAQAPIESRMIVEATEGDEIGAPIRGSMILVTVG